MEPVEESRYYWKGEPVLHKPLKRDNGKEPTVVEIFSGLGGLSMGFEMAGFKTVLGVDIHAPAVETFRKSHRNAFAILGDIKKILPEPFDNWDENLMAKALKNIKVDVLVAGVPCQGFSLCNRKRHIADDRNYLFLYVMECVKHIKPKYVLIENVSGLKSMNKGTFVKDIKCAIKDAGDGEDYEIETKTLNAAWFGVPQRRERIFFMGATKNHSVKWPDESEYFPSNRYRTVRDAIGDLPPLSNRQEKTKYKLSLSETTNEYQRLMRGVEQVLKNHIAPNHPDSTVKKIAGTRPGQPIYPKFKQRIRLSWDLPSPTQVSGGIRPQFQFGHPRDKRGLSVRERCRIQSIPDRVEIFGGVVQGRVQTGNAVPPLMAKAIADELIEELK